jgi:hypothetical protein
MELAARCSDLLSTLRAAHDLRSNVVQQLSSCSSALETAAQALALIPEANRTELVQQVRQQQQQQ